MLDSIEQNNQSLIKLSKELTILKNRSYQLDRQIKKLIRDFKLVNKTIVTRRKRRIIKKRPS